MYAFGVELDESCVCVFPSGATKREALDALIDAITRYDGTSDKDLFQLAVYQREAVMSTGIGGGVAVPHVRFDGVHRPRLSLGISKEGIDYDALDNEPVHILVLFAMPAGSEKEYLGMLAQVMMLLKMPGFRDALMACNTPAEVIGVLSDYGK